MPQGGLAALNAADTQDKILALKAFQYDIVCNGFELASGGIRNHVPEAMIKAFGIAGLGPEVVEARFGGMYRAFQYGAPPHGGMAAGIDRIVMLLVGAKNLREVALFPMNQQANDLLMGAPLRSRRQAAQRAAQARRPAGGGEEVRGAVAGIVLPGQPTQNRHPGPCGQDPWFSRVRSK
jgi:aspartyl-tRNA synthetase